MTPITEDQFHTVWTTAQGMVGYNKKFFQSLLANMKIAGLIQSETKV